MVQTIATHVDLGRHLLTASRALVGVAARSLADVDDITLPQWRALVIVSSREHVTVNDLATALAVHASTATRLCDRLVRKDLFERTHSSQDRRVVELRLTRSGVRLVNRVSRHRERELQAIAQRMPAAARSALAEGLAAFTEAAGEPAGVDLFGWSADE